MGEVQVGELGEFARPSFVKSAVRSALRPGVELDVDDGTVNLVSRLSDIARGEVAGYNVSRVGSLRQLFPRLSRADYLKLSYTDLPDSPVTLKQVLTGIQGLRDKDVAEFTLARRLARQDLGGGRYRDVVVPNLKDLSTEMDLADYDELEGVELEVIPGLMKRERKRTYTLTQVMSDGDVRAKYMLPMRIQVTGERLAATDAPAAAQIFQDAMNSVQSHTRVVVVPGMLAIDNVQAANVIRMMAYGCPVVSASIRSEVIGGRLYMYSHEEGEQGWHVLGPLKRATEVADLFRVVSAYGPTLPSGLLAVDLVQLRLDIYDGTTYAEPVMQFNVSVDGDIRASPGLSAAAARSMSSGQRSVFAAMSDRLLPVVNRTGTQLATAVRVTDRHVLVNDHVHAADTLAKVGGRRLVLSSRVARDVWAVECVGSSSPWAFREPVVGETAIIVYMVGDQVSCTSPVVIESVTMDTIMTTGSYDVVRGVSGGALVALTDFALFGIHSASVGSSLLNYRFGADQLEEVVGVDSSPSVSRVVEAESFAATVIKRFAEKGLGSSFKSTCAAVVPLWRDGIHHGMAMLDGGSAYSTIAEGGLYSDATDTQTLWFPEAAGRGLARAMCPWTDTRVPVRRAPRLGEKVFILGFDDMLYVTDQTDVAHVYAAGRGFVLRAIPGLDKPVAGGLVVAWDGSVVGLAGAEFVGDTPVGYGLKCWPIPKREASLAPSAREVLSMRFPFLRMDLWTDDLLEEVFTHPSVGRYRSNRVFNSGNRPLAVMGNAYVRFLNARVLRDQGVPHADWAESFKVLQSNVVVASLVEKFGLESCVQAGSGVALQFSTKSYADVVEALIGAATVVEGEEIVMRLCSELGMLQAEDTSASVVNVSEAAVD